MNDIIEKQEGIYEFTIPQKVNTETWLNDHLDCNAIIDYLGEEVVVYAFTLDPKYNYELKEYKSKQNFANQHLLRGISSDGLNGLF